MKGKSFRLKVRREIQIKNIWHQLRVGDIVIPKTNKPHALQRDLRQASRWPEDWTPPNSWLPWYKRILFWKDDFESSYDKKCWVECWIPRFGVKAQVRKQDFK